MRKSAPVIKAPLSLIRSSATFATSSAVPGLPAGHLKHIPVKVSPGTVQFVQGKRGDDNSGRNRVDTRSPPASFYRFCHDTLFVAALRKLIGVKRIPDILRL